LVPVEETLKNGIYFVGGLCIGVICCLTAVRFLSDQPVVHAASSQPKLIVKLHRFHLQADKLTEFDRWVQFEHKHHEETLATLEREKMYAEAIFRDPVADPTTIYWLEIRSPKGESVTTSPLAIDREYERFMSNTLVPHSRTTMNPEYVLIPPFMSEAITRHEEK
jgi:hypothetical protein